MTRGTTPTFILELQEEIDLATAAHVYVTFQIGTAQVTKADDELQIEGNEVSVYLSQSETLLFQAGKRVEVQLNWTYDDGGRAATNIVSIDVERNLISKVLE